MEIIGYNNNIVKRVKNDKKEKLNEEWNKIY